MVRVVAAFALLMLLSPGMSAAPQLVCSLSLPRPLGPQDHAYLEVTLGVLSAGQEIEVTTASGQALGVISPHGIRLGQAGGTYTLPIPSTVIRGNHVQIRLGVTRAGADTRAPTPEEVLGVRLTLAAGTNGDRTKQTKGTEAINPPAAPPLTGHVPGTPRATQGALHHGSEAPIP